MIKFEILKDSLVSRTLISQFISSRGFVVFTENVAKGRASACLELGRRFTLKPVYVKEVPLRRLPIDRNLANPLSDMDFRCYSDDGPFEIGLFRSCQSRLQLNLLGC